MIPRHEGHRCASVVTDAGHGVGEEVSPLEHGGDRAISPDLHDRSGHVVLGMDFTDAQHHRFGDRGEIAESLGLSHRQHRCEVAGEVQES